MNQKNNNITIKQALSIGKSKLKLANIDTATLDTELFLMSATGLSKIDLFVKDDYALTDKEIELFNNYLERREKNEPVAYILGHQEFMGLDFKVNSSTLIPRGDTEVLVEEVIKKSKINNYETFLDIGTGSGAIAISLAYYIPTATFTAVDISPKALETAKHNAELNSVSNRIKFIQSDVYSALSSNLYDVIVSNPPYIKTEIISTLGTNVKDYEPFTALDGGKDGLIFYRQIIDGSINHLKKDGMLFFEIGHDQGQEVSDLMKAKNFKDITILKDLAGLDRVVYGKL